MQESLRSGEATSSYFETSGFDFALWSFKTWIVSFKISLFSFDQLLGPAPSRSIPVRISGFCVPLSFRILHAFSFLDFSDSKDLISSQNNSGPTRSAIAKAHFVAFSLSKRPLLLQEMSSTRMI